MLVVVLNCCAPQTFQKGALHRQMLDYKRECERIAAKAETLERDYRDNLHRLVATEECWKQVCSIHAPSFGRSPGRAAAALAEPLPLSVHLAYQLVDELKTSLGDAYRLESTGDDDQDTAMSNGHEGGSRAR